MQRLTIKTKDDDTMSGVYLDGNLIDGVKDLQLHFDAVTGVPTVTISFQASVKCVTEGCECAS